ncbi:MAG: VanW family protein [Clostridium sp.]
MTKKVKILIAVLTIAILSVPIGILVDDSLTPKDKIYNGITVNGTQVGELSLKEASDVLQKQYNNKVENKNIKVSYEDFTYDIDYKSLKAHYNIDLAVKEAMDYGKEGNPFTRFFTRLTLKNKPHNIELKFLADSSRLKEDVKVISKKIDQKAKNATISYNGSSFNITKEKPGKVVDQAKLESELISAVNPQDRDEKVIVPVNVDKPKITASELSSIDKKISSFSTNFNPGDANRVGNIQLATRTISGSVIMPGEVFSTNKTLGPRVKSNGYKEAPTIVNGTLTPGLGGGICQVSSTLYNTALLANLQIVERRNHSLKVGYLPASRDAVISEDYIDLKFKNDTNYPIFIQGSVSGNTVTINMYGSSLSPERKVVLSQEVYETIPNPKEGGKPQIKSRAYRKVYDINGKLIKDEMLSKDHYKG